MADVFSSMSSEFFEEADDSDTSVTRLPSEIKQPVITIDFIPYLEE
jgi:hypothetical protein